MSSWLTLKWLEELLGKEAAAKLAESFGGSNLYIPEKVYDSHIITKAIGRDAMAILSAHHAKEIVAIPKGQKSQKPRVLALINEGVSKREIARRLGVSDRYVRMVSNPAKGPKRNRKSPSKKHPNTISEEVRFAASACGLSQMDFIKQAFDLLRISNGIPIEQQLAIWKKRQRAVAKQVDQCERMALEQRLKNQR
jgi:transposase